MLTGFVPVGGKTAAGARLSDTSIIFNQFFFPPLLVEVVESLSSIASVTAMAAIYRNLRRLRQGVTVEGKGDLLRTFSDLTKKTCCCCCC